jgi:site-specific recombinase XerD
MSDVSYLFPQQRKKSQGNKTYYGGISTGGVVRWVTLKTKNEREATNWYAKMQASRYAPKEEKPVTLKLTEATEAYLADVEKVRRRSRGTVKEYQKHLRLFGDWCKEKNVVEFTDITPKICSEYAVEKLSAIAGNTAKTRTIVLRSFFRWVGNTYNINTRNPFTGISLAKGKPAPRKFWTLEECEKVIEAAENEELKCWFAFMAYAGLRKEEARQLKIENIAEGKISLTGKGGKLATLPMSPRLKGYLEKYLLSLGENKSGFLFPKLAKLSGNLERFISSAAKAAKATHWETAHYHRFRHSFASNLLRNGRNIKAVQVLMRHENVALTLNIYGHLLPSDLEKEVDL